jgi:hypothetical protein
MHWILLPMDTMSKLALETSNFDTDADEVKSGCMHVGVLQQVF